MKFRSDIVIAWALLSMLRNQPRKAEYWSHKITRDFGIRVPLYSFKKIISALKSGELLKAIPNKGIWASDIKIIRLSYVYNALGVDLPTTKGPLKDSCSKIRSVIKETVIINNWGQYEYEKF